MKDLFKERITKSHTKSPLQTESRTSSQSNNYYSTSNCLKSSNQINTKRLNTNSNIKASINLNCSSSMHNRAMSLRIKRIINQINEELCLPPKTINSPPYEKIKDKAYDSKEHLLLISPLKIKTNKKRHYCLLDIINRSKASTNMKVVKGLDMETQKEVNKKIDEANLKKFMDKLISPSYNKLVCNNHNKKEALY